MNLLSFRNFLKPLSSKMKCFPSLYNILQTSSLNKLPSKVDCFISEKSDTLQGPRQKGCHHSLSANVMIIGITYLARQQDTVRLVMNSSGCLGGKHSL